MMSNWFRTRPFARAFEQAALVAVDVGARGGFDSELLAAAWAVDAIGFEPDSQAFALLGDLPPGPWRSQRWLPAALGGAIGTATLHIPTNPIAASLLVHDPAIGDRFGMQTLTDCAMTAQVELTTLAQAQCDFGIGPISYLKLDVEGAELDILRGAGDALTSVLAVKAEAAFIPMRRDQPLVDDLMRWMREQNFELMEIVRPYHWRKGPVAPHPYVRAADIAYSRGQIAHCDLLFFRSPEFLTLPEDRARAALLAMAMGYFDHACMLLQSAGCERVMADWGVTEWQAPLAQASRAFGRRQALAALYGRFRDAIPLVRSILAGLPD